MMRSWWSVSLLFAVSLHFAAGQSQPGGPPTLTVTALGGHAGSCGATSSHRTWHFFNPIVTLDTSNGYNPSMHRVWPLTEQPEVYRGGVVTFPHIPEMNNHITAGVVGKMQLCNITIASTPMVECPLPPLRDERFRSGRDMVAVSFQAQVQFPAMHMTTLTFSYPSVNDGTVSVDFSGGCDPMFSAPASRTDVPKVYASANPGKESGPACGVGAMSYVVLAAVDGDTVDPPIPFDHPVTLYVSFTGMAVDLTTISMKASLVPTSGHLRGSEVACAVGPAPAPAAGNGYHCDISSLMTAQWRDLNELNRVVRLELIGFAAREVSGEVTVVINGGTADESVMAAVAAPFGCAYGPDGCKPRDFAGYLADCNVWGLPGDTCSVVGCDVPIYSGAVVVTPSRDTSAVRCVGGSWVGQPKGCEKLPVSSTLPACGPQKFTSRLLGCPAGPMGATCTLSSTCEANYLDVGGPDDVMTCLDGFWVGEEKKCVPNAPLVLCGDLSQPAYDFMCTPTYSPTFATHGMECRPTECSANGMRVDVMTPPSGKMKCVNGVWEGAFVGCDGNFGPDCTPSTLVLPVGYIADCGGGSVVPHGGSCAVRCDPFTHTGVAVGSNVCFGGQWYAHYSGCEVPCQLPPTMCDPATGKMLNGLVVRGLYGEQHVDGGCNLVTKGRPGLWRAECQGQYVLSNKTVRASLSPTICASGTLVGGFAAQDGPPECALADDEVARECTCGKAGRVPRVSTRMVHGMFRSNGYAVGQNEWVCERVGNFVQCRCQC